MTDEEHLTSEDRAWLEEQMALTRAPVVVGYRKVKPITHLFEPRGPGLMCRLCDEGEFAERHRG